MNAQQKTMNAQTNNNQIQPTNQQQSNGVPKKERRQMNKYLLQFKEQQLEQDFNKSQTKQLSRYSYKIFFITIIPLLITTFLLPFSYRSGGIPSKIYVFYCMPIVVFIANLFVQKKYPQLFDYTHIIIVVLLHLLISWQMVDHDITTFSSFSEFYKGFIFAHVYIFLYISSKYTTKVILILVVNISGIFIFPHHSNIWIMVVGQVFLMLMLTVKFYNEDFMKRQLFVQTRKQNLWDNIIEEFLPINLIVVKYNKQSQRLELSQTNKCARKKLRIFNDDELQHFLDFTVIETNDNTTTSFMNNFQAPTHHNLVIDAQSQKNGYNTQKSNNFPFQRQMTGFPQGQDMTKSLNLGYFGNTNGAKNAHSDKFTLKKLLKNKLLKQLDQKSQQTTNQQQMEQERQRKQSQAEGDITMTNNAKNTNNTFENLEQYTANFMTENGRQKKLSIKVFTFCLVDNFAVLTIESESFKSKLRKQEKKNEFQVTFHKEIAQRVEKNCKNIVYKLSQFLLSLGPSNSNLSYKFREILQLSYEMLILNKNATDFMQNQEKQNSKKQKKPHALSSAAKNRLNKFDRGLTTNPLSSSNKGLINNSSNNFIFSNKKYLDICEFNPKKELFGWLNIFQSKLEKKKLHIFHEIDSMIGIVTNDKNKFNQIIFNLLDNAIKFTPQNGKIAIIFKRNLVSSHVIDIHVINTLEKDLDTFPLIRDLEQTLQESSSYNHNIITASNSNQPPNDDDFYNVLKKIKLGIPVSRKLIQLIGPNNNLDYKFKNNQIILHFQIFQDIRILKQTFEDSLQNKYSHQSLNGERTIFSMKIPTLLKDKLNTFQTTSLQKPNLFQQESKTIPFSTNFSNTSLPGGQELGLGKQFSLKQKLNYQAAQNGGSQTSAGGGYLSMQSLTQLTKPIKRLKSNNNSTDGQQSFTSRNLVSPSKTTVNNSKVRSISNQYSSINRQNSSNQTFNNLDIIPSTNELMIELNSPEYENNNSQKNKLNSELLSFTANNNKLFNFKQNNGKDSFSLDKLQKSRISVIQECGSENNIELNSNNNIFKMHKNGIKSSNKLLQSQKLLLKETELDVIKSQKQNLQISNFNEQQQQQQKQQQQQQNQEPTSKPSLTENPNDLQKIYNELRNNRLNIQNISNDRINNITKNNIAINKIGNNNITNNNITININNVKQTQQNIFGQKDFYGSKNINSKRFNFSEPQTSETVKDMVLLKESHSPLEQTNQLFDQNSLYNSMESGSLNFVKNIPLTNEKLVNNKQIHFFPYKSNIENHDEISSIKRGDNNLPYIPKISQDQDQQLSFDGWQNVDEQHNDSFQKWMEISTLRKYNELEFSLAFKPIQNFSKNNNNYNNNNNSNNNYNNNINSRNNSVQSHHTLNF